MTLSPKECRDLFFGSINNPGLEGENREKIRYMNQVEIMKSLFSNRGWVGIGESGVQDASTLNLSSARQGASELILMSIISYGPILQIRKPEALGVGKVFQPVRNVPSYLPCFTEMK